MNNVKSVAESLPPAKTSGLAIASLVLGICGIFTCGLSAIAGLILGIVGLCAIKKRAEQLKGQALAVAGIIVSAIIIVLIFFTAIMMVLLMPALSGVRTQGKIALSMNNAKQICMAINLYCEDNDGRFPPADIWPAALAPYLGDAKILESPFAPHTGLSYVMNVHLNNRNIRDIKQPHRMVLIFEAPFGGPTAGGRELLIHRPRGRKGHIIGFLDGHVECVRQEMLDKLIWIPGTQPFDIIR